MQLDPGTMVMGVAALADIAADMLFLVVTIAGIYWLVVFKLQSESFAVSHGTHPRCSA